MSETTQARTHIDPPLRRLLDDMVGPDDATPPTELAERRALADATMMLIHPGALPGVVVQDHQVAVAGGEIRVRVSRPEAIAGPAPTLFFIHGGGWFQGNLDTGEVECGPMAPAVPCAVVSVEYRLAPEHPFPTGLDDCVAAYEWLLANVERLGVDPVRIAVGGTSAGGNLAAALCLVARDRGLPMPIAQVLDVPALDLTLSSPSMDSVGEDAGLVKAAVAEFVDLYAAGRTELTNPLVSPLFADLGGLPPAVVVVAEHDPVRDDGERYVQRLHESGVAAFGIRVLAHFHGSWIIPITTTNRLLHDLRVATLRRVFDGTLVP